MNPIGYAQRLKRSRVRRRETEPPWFTPIPVTSRPAYGVHRVNPERNLAYMVRTMARPRESYVLTAEERNRITDHEEAWQLNREDPTFQSDFVDWRAAVEQYAKAKKLAVEWTAEMEGFPVPSTIFRWKVQEGR